MNLLIDLMHQAMAERGRADYYSGGNMFVHYSVEQANAVATQPVELVRHFRGPDVFWVGGVDGRGDRDYWAVWEEGGRYPDLIVELLSPTTARVDRTTKKAIYERTFKTQDYVLYDREEQRIEGYHLVAGSYREQELDPRGWLRLETLGLWLGKWQGTRTGVKATWLRLFDDAGRMIPDNVELLDGERQRADGERQRADAEQQRADAEKQRADAEKQRADALAAELARLRRED
jgi:Uma2 family endonuclease